MDESDSITVIAPFGLYDLFNLVARHNAARTSVQTFRERLAAKGFERRWPMVRVVEGGM